MKKITSMLAAFSLTVTSLPAFAVSAEDVTPLIGDVNEDGYVDYLDGRTIMEYYSKNIAMLNPYFSEDTEENARIFELADLNADGIINMSDWELFLSHFSPRKGDVTYSGNVDPADVIALQEYCVAVASGEVTEAPSEAFLQAADMDGDGVITLADAELIQANYTPKQGDVNEDGILDAADVKIVLQYYTDKVAGQNPVFSEDAEKNARIFELADMDGDGAIKMADVTAITGQFTAVRGDVDGNGKVDIEDAINVLTYYAQKAAGLSTGISEDNEKNFLSRADTDKNDMITINDAVSILDVYVRNASGESTVPDVIESFEWGNLDSNPQVLIY